MDITFIQAGMSGARAKDAMEPLAFSVLAGLTPKKHRITFYDDRLELVPKKLNTYLVAISTGTYTAARAYQLAKQYRDQGIKVVLGGYHPTLLPEEAMEYADSVVIGDAEGAWPCLLEDIERGRLKPAYRSAQETEREKAFCPDISKTYYDETIFAGKKYSRITPVQFSRGCRYNCEFCSVSAFYGGSIRYRDIRSVTEEIKRKNERFVFFTDDNLLHLPISLMQFSRGCKNCCSFCASSVFFNQRQYCRPVQDVVDEIQTQKLKLVFFVDDNIVADRERAKELFRALIPLRIKWVSQASIDMTGDAELMELMMKSGCLGNVIGFEAICRNILEHMNKTGNIGADFDGYRKQIRVLRHFGHQTWAAFTLGHDEDTKESIEELYQFAVKNKFAFAAFNILMPYPNTPLYRKPEQENRLCYDGKWWLHDDFRFIHA